MVLPPDGTNIKSIVNSRERWKKVGAFFFCQSNCQFQGTQLTGGCKEEGEKGEKINWEPGCWKVAGALPGSWPPREVSHGIYKPCRARNTSQGTNVDACYRWARLLWNIL